MAHSKHIQTHIEINMQKVHAKWVLLITITPVITYRKYYIMSDLDTKSEKNHKKDISFFFQNK